MAAQRIFVVADLNARGEVRAQTDYSYEELEQIPGAGDLIAQFSTAIWRDPEEFESQLAAATRLKLRWLAVAPTAGIATLRHEQELTSLSLLCTGKNEQADQITLDAFQKHLLRELHDTGFEPSFELMALKRRPLEATVNFYVPRDALEQMMVALADRCFAASYFRYQGLA